MEVLERTLSDQVVRVAYKSHEDLQCRLKRDLVIVVNDQRLEQVVWRAIKHPLEAASVQVFELLSVVIDLVICCIGEEHLITNTMHRRDWLLASRRGA